MNLKPIDNIWLWWVFYFVLNLSDIIIYWLQPGLLQQATLLFHKLQCFMYLVHTVGLRWYSQIFIFVSVNMTYDTLWIICHVYIWIQINIFFEWNFLYQKQYQPIHDIFMLKIWQIYGMILKNDDELENHKRDWISLLHWLLDKYITREGILHNKCWVDVFMNKIHISYFIFISMFVFAGYCIHCSPSSY